MLRNASSVYLQILELLLKVGSWEKAKVTGRCWWSVLIFDLQVGVFGESSLSLLIRVEQPISSSGTNFRLDTKGMSGEKGEMSFSNCRKTAGIYFSSWKSEFSEKLNNCFSAVQGCYFYACRTNFSLKGRIAALEGLFRVTNRL